MAKKTVTIALAFVGLLVGAGFASGQEVVQYFISFGTMGLWGSWSLASSCVPPAR